MSALEDHSRYRTPIRRIINKRKQFKKLNLKKPQYPQNNQESPRKKETTLFTPAKKRVEILKSMREYFKKQGKASDAEKITNFIIKRKQILPKWKQIMKDETKIKLKKNKIKSRTKSSETLEAINFRSALMKNSLDEKIESMSGGKMHITELWGEREFKNLNLASNLREIDRLLRIKNMNLTGVFQEESGQKKGVDGVVGRSASQGRLQRASKRDSGGCRTRRKKVGNLSRRLFKSSSFMRGWDEAGLFGSGFDFPVLRDKNEFLSKIRNRFHPALRGSRSGKEGRNTAGRGLGVIAESENPAKTTSRQNLDMSKTEFLLSRVKALRATKGSFKGINSLKGKIGAKNRPNRLRNNLDKEGEEARKGERGRVGGAKNGGDGDQNEVSAARKLFSMSSINQRLDNISGSVEGAEDVEIDEKEAGNGSSSVPLLKNKILGQEIESKKKSIIQRKSQTSHRKSDKRARNDKKQPSLYLKVKEKFKKRLTTQNAHSCHYGQAQLKQRYKSQKRIPRPPNSTQSSQAGRIRSKKPSKTRKRGLFKSKQMSSSAYFQSNPRCHSGLSRLHHACSIELKNQIGIPARLNSSGLSSDARKSTKLSFVDMFLLRAAMYSTKKRLGKKVTSDDMQIGSFQGDLFQRKKHELRRKLHIDSDIKKDIGEMWDRRFQAEKLDSSRKGDFMVG